jgi:hypothetical protein
MCSIKTDIQAALERSPHCDLNLCGDFRGDIDCCGVHDAIAGELRSNRLLEFGGRFDLNTQNGIETYLRRNTK